MQGCATAVGSGPEFNLAYRSFVIATRGSPTVARLAQPAYRPLKGIVVLRCTVNRFMSLDIHVVDAVRSKGRHAQCYFQHMLGGNVSHPINSSIKIRPAFG